MISDLEEGALLLGIDTCGAMGSIALGKVRGDVVELLGQVELAGGEFAARLVAAIAELLASAGVTLADVAGLVAVAGPGSFTGIRIGLAAAKAIAESGRLPVVTVSRLALLAEGAEADCAVLDAHRGQFYCGIYDAGEAREMLLTAGEMNAMGGLKGRVAVCEETVAQLLEELCGDPRLVRTAAPTAADTIRLSMRKWRSGELADVASLDGYYLRGADAKVSARLG